jgi:hypothetical protein
VIIAQKVHALALVLEAEETLYVEMRDLLQRERECMVSLDADGLEQAVEAKEALAEEARLLEEGRLDVAADLAHALGLPESRPTLSQLLEAAGVAGERLHERHSRLVALLAAVRELVDANASFARDGLEQVQGTLKLLGRLLPQEPVYRPAEPPRAGDAAGRLVRGFA